jgi:tetraacyldisaccharide 4'-kinase
MTFPEHPAARALLTLPSLAYGCLVRVRNRYYDRPGRSRSVGIPVISVGNLSTGGTGKTPFVQWLCRRLLELDETPAVVTRGYGGKAGSGPLVVSRGGGPLVPAGRCGDEPYLLAESLEKTLVVAGSDRIAGAREAIRLGGSIAVLDDGFQHRRLHRDLDILLLDQKHPEGNGKLLPSGPLREPPSGIRRAGVVVLTRNDPADDLSSRESWIRRYNLSAPVLTARHVPAGFRDRDGAPRPVPDLVFGFCGIARPDSFRAGLRETGAREAGFRAFRDHYRYSDRDLLEMASLADAAGAVLVTTRKDLARLSDRNDPVIRRILALELELTVDSPERLLEPVRGVITGGGVE